MNKSLTSKAVALASLKFIKYSRKIDTNTSETLPKNTRARNTSHFII